MSVSGTGLADLQLSVLATSACVRAQPRLSAGCADATAKPTAARRELNATACTDTWTVLVYMAAEYATHPHIHARTHAHAHTHIHTHTPRARAGTQAHTPQ